MTKLEFIAAFKTSSDSLPSELLEAALADYERQFTEQLLSGLSEQVIVERWGSPHTAALKLKLNTFNGNLKQPLTMEKALRIVLVAVGLGFLDLILLIPMTIYFVMFGVFFIVACLAYLVGIVASVSSLTGVSDIQVPAYYLPPAMVNQIELDNVQIGPGVIGVVVSGDVKAPLLSTTNSTTASANANSATPSMVTPSADRTTDVETAAALSESSFDKLKHVHITTGLPTYGIWNGVGMTVAGIALLLLWLLALRFTFRMAKRFISWHFQSLKNA